MKTDEVLQAIFEDSQPDVTCPYDDGTAEAWAWQKGIEAWQKGIEFAGVEAQRQQLLDAAQKTYKWSQTPDTKPGGSFAHFAEVCVPALYEAIRRSRP